MIYLTASLPSGCLSPAHAAEQMTKNKTLGRVGYHMPIIHPIASHCILLSFYAV
jgi:hypothetical protein